MEDKILLKKIQIWLDLPLRYRKKEKQLSSKYGNIIIKLDNMLIIKEIFIYKDYRGLGIWSNLISELEKLNINIKVQSVLNQRLMKFLINRGWKSLDYELSVIWIKSI